MKSKDLLLNWVRKLRMSHLKTHLSWLGWHLNWLSWAHAGLVHEISDAVSSQEQQLCHVQKTLFAMVLPDLWLLQYCLSLLCNHPWSLETGWYYSCPTLAKPFADIDSLWPVVSFCVSFCSLHSKTSIMRSKSITNLWLCAFSRVIIVGVPGPCSPKPWVLGQIYSTVHQFLVIEWALNPIRMSLATLITGMSVLFPFPWG